MDETVIDDLVALPLPRSGQSAENRCVNKRSKLTLHG
jgi:hypothetical protein